MKITLVETKTKHFYIASKYFIPRLGLPLLGTILAQKGHVVSIYCEELSELDESELYSSDLVGISAVTSTVNSAYELARKLKDRKIPVVLGGVHPTFMPDEALLYADYCVRGEGEETIVELTEALGQPDKLAQIKGLSYKDGEKVCHNPPRPPLANLDALPVPDFKLIRNYSKMRVLPLETSRGCPFSCDFCSVSPMFGTNLRFRSIDNILQHLKEYYKISNPLIFFTDDNFTADKKRAKELLGKIKEQGLAPRKWIAQVRLDAAGDGELIDLMKDTHVYRLYVGFESVNNKTLALYKKHQHVKQIEDGIEVFRQKGLPVHGMFVLGSDEDELEIISQTVKFALDKQINTVNFSILTPLPGSKLFSRLDKEGRILHQEWDYYDLHHCVFQPKKMSPYVLQQATAKALREFYSFKSFLDLLGCAFRKKYRLDEILYRFYLYVLNKKITGSIKNYYKKLEGLQKI